MAVEQYASTSDLASLAMPASALQAVTTDDQNRALQRASAKLSSRMVPAWMPPFTSWGDDLRGYTCDVAAWDLLSKRGAPPDDPGIQIYAKRHDDAIKWAEDVGRGVIVPRDLVDSSPTEDDGAPEVSSAAQRGW